MNKVVSLRRTAPFSFASNTDLISIYFVSYGPYQTILKTIFFSSKGFEAFRADETLCDVVLVPGDSKEAFPVHRVIMASCSDYFKAMFTGLFYFLIE